MDSMSNFGRKISAKGRRPEFYLQAVNIRSHIRAGRFRHCSLNEPKANLGFEEHEGGGVL
jgi:hypothetical protein